MKAKRVLMVGGMAESVVRFRGDLLKQLVQLGHEIHAAAGGDDHEQTEDTLRKWGIEYHRLPLGRASVNPLGDAAAIIAIYKLCKTLEPDIVLSYTLKPVLYTSIAAHWARVPGIYSMITGLGYAFSGGGLKRNLLRYLFIHPMLKHALNANQLVFFQNRDDLALFHKEGILCKNKPTRMLGGSGVNLTEYKASGYPSEPSFLLIARLIADKGIREYVSAAREIKRAYPQARFHLVGWIDNQNPTSIAREELESWVREGVIEYHGKLNDVRAAIAAASVYVLPSSYREGIPRSILEAMAMGRPVITTDTPGCRETVMNGINGYLVEPGSAAAVANAMREFIEHPHLINKMGDASLKLVRARFDVKKVNADIVEAMGMWHPLDKEVMQKIAV